MFVYIWKQGALLFIIERDSAYSGSETANEEDKGLLRSESHP